LSIGADITELKKAQRELTDEKANMDVILSFLRGADCKQDWQAN
jgi:hypothetical protein